ncbi:casein kinase I / CK1.5 [Leishmania donovani]|uniref:non-specific serine/threonine protein kinase n=1 Tax=Leishmania donovani TaxID=5661 RepID=A0A3S7WZA2_LEIDO|nr:casein kinase I, putative [Leishmania donovani]AYU79500.1 casein kinase I, putative [Leishmania donovani]TPP40775.1 Protein kinase domain family protein [Leishmania donovani]TPP48873.1 Protein kinase domain family protein [Leishmania donovani]CAJ1989490.1 casein kinase I / CK1.5 [Leishmania donovani]CBZ34794.1 casein kinase I, putative [Leishmania donovani]
MASVSEKYQPTGKEVPFGGGRFLLSHRLGNGSFGDIFEGYDKKSHRIVAVKLERKKARYPQLSYESKVYRVLHQPPVGQNEVNPKQLFAEGSNHSVVNGGTAQGDSNNTPSNLPQSVNATAQQQRKSLEISIVVGIPQIYYFDSEGDYNIMVMEMCGPSLEDVFNYCHRRFSLKTVLMIADQLLHRIQYFHEKGFVHRDIKPENFVFGCRSKAHILYIIDYGLSKLYWEVKKNSHIPFAEGRPLTGTARYCSTNVHRGFEQSRRDDLESIGFLLIYFLRGNLPWQGIQAKDQQIKTIKIGETKMATPLEELCKGMPKEFLNYCQYCRSLSFTQKPDYDSLRRLFRDLGKRLGLTLPARDLPSGNFCAANRTGAKPSNPLAVPAMLSTDITSPTDSRLLSVVSESTVNSRRSHPFQTPSTVAAQVLPTLEDVDPMRGPYDWCFDWFCKRQMEVKRGMEEQSRQQRLETQMSAIASRNSELRLEDVSDVMNGSTQRDKNSAFGSKRPMFSSPLQPDRLRM